MKPAGKKRLRSLWLLVASSAPAQTYIVAAGGGGHFTDLPAAVAAVPSGATLHVKAGTYSPFTVQSKTLTLIAETVGAATIQVATSSPVVVTGIGASDHVHVSGFLIKGNAGLVTPTVSIKACAGNVILDRVSAEYADVVVDHCSSVHILSSSLISVGNTGYLAPRLVVTAANVEVADSTITGFSGYPGSSLASGGLEARLGSVVTISGSTVVGGSAALPGGRGADGVIASGSTVHVLGQGPSWVTRPSQIIGGAGGPQPPESGNGGDGGDGLALDSGARARVFGAALVAGGAGGTSRPGRPGMPLRVDASSVAAQYASTGPSAFLNGTVGAGLVVKASLRSPPGAAAALFLGTVNRFLQPWPIALGAWTVDAPLVVSGLSVPASGLLEVPINVPVGWPGDTIVVGQFLILDAVLNEVQASNTFVAITR